MVARILYTYFRSSAAYRVRIALVLKDLDYRSHFVHLLREGGQHRCPEYLQVNPQGLVPTLVDDGLVITQSLAIIEYLEERYPEPSLLPQHPKERACVRSLAQLVACDIHPLNNLRVMDYLRDRLHQNGDSCLQWYQHWVYEGFRALELQLERKPSAGRCCFGDTPTLADVCLIPQVFNAQRFGCNMQSFPVLSRIYEYCRRLAAFRQAAPENQGDAETS